MDLKFLSSFLFLSNIRSLMEHRATSSSLNFITSCTLSLIIGSGEQTLRGGEHMEDSWSNARLKQRFIAMPQQHQSTFGWNVKTWWFADIFREECHSHPYERVNEEITTVSGLVSTRGSGSSWLNSTAHTSSLNAKLGLNFYLVWHHVKRKQVLSASHTHTSVCDIKENCDWNFCWRFVLLQLALASWSHFEHTHTSRMYFFLPVTIF